MPGIWMFCAGGGGEGVLGVLSVEGLGRTCWCCVRVGESGGVGRPAVVTYGWWYCVRVGDAWGVFWTVPNRELRRRLRTLS